MDMIQIAKAYLSVGLSVIPIKKNSKRPDIPRWKPYQTMRAQDKEINEWFGNGKDSSLAIITGQVSGDLELLDFDNKAELAKAWGKNIPIELKKRLVAERSQSGGLHIVYRCNDCKIPGNMKLAQRKIDDKIQALIETRGTGGYFLSYPSPGYELIQGTFTNIPVITGEERDILISAAAELNECAPDIREIVDIPVRSVSTNGELSPGDDFSNRGEVAALLQERGWTITGRKGQTQDGTETIYLTRPGKSISKGHSASLINGRVLYVWSSNAHPFEPGKAYSPFAVYTILNHGGDFSAAAKQLAAFGYGTMLDNAGQWDDLLDNAGQQPKMLDSAGQPGQMLDSARTDAGQMLDEKEVVMDVKGKNAIKTTTSSEQLKENLAHRFPPPPHPPYKVYNIREILTKNIPNITDTQMKAITEEIDIAAAAPPESGQTASIQNEYRDWVQFSGGEFRLADFFSYCGIKTRQLKRLVYNINERLISQGKIIHVSRGVYRIVDEDCDQIDFLNAVTDEANVYLPLGVNKFAAVMPGNIIVVAGEANAGKTSYLLNIAGMNMNKARVVYCSSEMGGGELKRRLQGFSSHEFHLEDWAKVTWLDRSSNFADVIVPGEGVINIIDFLEIHDDFWRIGKELKAIHDNLKGAIAVIAIQKNKGAEMGRGGSMGLEKPRIYLSMGSGWMKAVKIKNWKGTENPNGKIVRFKLRNGAIFSTRGGWIHEDES